MILILGYTSGTITLPVLVSLFGFTAITMSFGHLHEVICRPKSLDEWAVASKLWRLQAHLIGYVPQCFAWALVIAQLVVSLRPPSKYYQGEIAYMWLSLFAKGLLGLLILSNVLILGSYTEIYEV